MDLNLSVDGEVRVKMTDYLKNIVSEFLETIQIRVTSLAVEHLFTVMEEKDWATAFHNSVAQLLFATPCVRKNI